MEKKKPVEELLRASGVDLSNGGGLQSAVCLGRVYGRVTTANVCASPFVWTHSSWQNSLFVCLG
jgi:hypothetical protein